MLKNKKELGGQCSYLLRGIWDIPSAYRKEADICKSYK